MVAVERLARPRSRGFGGRHPGGGRRRTAGGTLLCNYDTMILCEEGRAGRQGGCIANPRLGTTGGPPANAPALSRPQGCPIRPEDSIMDRARLRCQAPPHVLERAQPILNRLMTLINHFLAGGWPGSLIE